MLDDTSLSIVGKEPKLPDMVQQATTPQPQPTGDGEIVLPFALERLIDDTRNNTDEIRLALIKRAIAGRSKYGTYLRTHNGRNAGVDYLQEQLDAIMYATQLHMENSSPVTARMIDLAVQAAKLAMDEIKRLQGHA